VTAHAPTTNNHQSLRCQSSSISTCLPAASLKLACLSIYLSICYLLDQPPCAANGLGRVRAEAVAAGGVLIGDKRSRRAVAAMLELEGGPISLFIYTWEDGSQSLEGGRWDMGGGRRTDGRVGEQTS